MKSSCVLTGCICGISGLALGAVAGYFYAKKTLERKYADICDEEVEETRKALEKVISSQATMKAKKDNAPTQEEKDKAEELSKPYKSNRPATIFTTEPPKAEDIKADEPVIFDANDDPSVEPFGDFPVVVDADVAINNQEDWDVETLEWYGGSVLVAATGAELDIDETIGRAALDIFNEENPNHGLCNGDCIYVRVPALKLYYEVVKDIPVEESLKTRFKDKQ